MVRVQALPDLREGVREHTAPVDCTREVVTVVERNRRSGHATQHWPQSGAGLIAKPLRALHSIILFA